MINNYAIGDDKDKHLNFYEMPSDKHTIDKMIKCLKKGKRIIVNVLGKKECAVVYEMIKLKCPNKKGRYYTSETGYQKEEILNVNKSWINYDYLVFNTTLGAGINFDRKHFHIQFVIGNNKCKATIQNLLQLMGRNRFLIDKKVYFYMPPGSEHKLYISRPITKNNVLADLITLDKIRIKKETEIVGLTSHPIVVDGIILWRIDTDDFWTKLKVSRIVDDNITYCFYRRLFKYFITSRHHTIHSYDPNTFDDEIETKDFNKLKKSAKSYVNNTILDLYDKADISKSSVNKAKEKIKTSSFTQSDIITTKKYNFQDYCTEDLTPEELVFFGKNENKIRNYLIEHQSDYVSEYVRNIRDVKQDPTFDKLFYIKQLCQILGMKHSCDLITFDDRDLFFNNYKKDILKDFETYKSIFKKRTKNVPKTADTFVKFLSSIFTSWTGTSIECIEEEKTSKGKSRRYSVNFVLDHKFKSIHKKLNLEKDKLYVNSIVNYKPKIAKNDNNIRIEGSPNILNTLMSSNLSSSNNEIDNDDITTFNRLQQYKEMDPAIRPKLTDFLYGETN
jgi:hypothetical protein